MKIKIEKPGITKLDELGVRDWPVWECESSTFDWHYDREETCYILEGKINIRTGDGEISIGPGDFVIFPKGLDCIWTVIKPVRKHYSFS